MAKKFALVQGLHNIFDIQSNTYITASVKTGISTIDQDSVAYIVADSTDGPSTVGTTTTYKFVKIGGKTTGTPVNVGDSYIWTHGVLYACSSNIGQLTFKITDDDWIDLTMSPLNSDGSVDVNIQHVNNATGTTVPSSGTAEVNGTSSSGGVDVITGFKLDSNGHVTNVTRTKIYATPVTISDGTTVGNISAGDGKYISGVSLSDQEITFTQKDNGVFSDGTGTTAGKLVVTTGTNNKVDDSKYTILEQGSASGSVLTDSDSLIPTSKAVKEAIVASVVPTMEFKGTTSVLPAAGTPSGYTPEEGDMWKIVPVSPATTIEIQIPVAKSADGKAHTAKLGDTIIADDSNPVKWWYIPSGDDIEDTWRQLKVNGNNWLGIGTNTGVANFKSGTAITLEATEGQSDLTIKHSDVTRSDPSTGSSTITDGGKFTAVTGVTSNDLGHVTAVSKTEFQIPTAGDGALKVKADSGTAQSLFTANQTTGTDSTLTISGGDVLTSKIDGTDNNKVVIDHDQLTSAQKTAVAPADPSSNTNIDQPNGATVVISGITVNDYGHVTSVSKTKITSAKVNDQILTLTGNNSNKTVVIYADAEARPSAGGDADTFSSNDDTAATYYVYYTGSSDATDWGAIGFNN